MLKMVLPVASLAMLVLPSFFQDPRPTSQPHGGERAAIEQVGHDYLDALYKCQPELIAKSVHPKLKKLGFYRPSGDAPYRLSPMSYEQLEKLSGTWNKDGSHANADSVREVKLLDHMDTTAVLRVTAVWGVDYMQVGKFDGTWQVVHILWQSPPQQGE
ncbi:MAG: nuclear transport factor 2 family protein [Planctomycetota bacterium]